MKEKEDEKKNLEKRKEEGEERIVGRGRVANKLLKDKSLFHFENKVLKDKLLFQFTVYTPDKINLSFFNQIDKEVFGGGGGQKVKWIDVTTAGGCKCNCI